MVFQFNFFNNSLSTKHPGDHNLLTFADNFYVVSLIKRSGDI